MTLEYAFSCSTVEEVVNLLKEYKQDAKIIAGGTDVIIALRNSKISPKVLIDIAKVEELKKIENKKEKITIGAAVTYTQIVEDELFKNNLYGMLKACKMVGSPQIRNKGTIGGNIANASPAADSIPPLIALGASIKILGSKGERVVLLEDYFSDKKTHGLMPDELIVCIEFDKPNKNQVLSFSKLGLRKALAISRATLSALVGLSEDKHIESIKVASGSIGKYPMRELELENALIGKEFNAQILDEAISVIQASMDIRLEGRSTLPYKRQAIISLLEELLIESRSYFNEVTI